MQREGGNGSLADRIFESLRHSLVTCQLPPGTAFNELQWARRFKTSRTPVREACNRLIKERLLVAVPNKGYFVSPITFHDVLNIYQLRFIVETACARVAARRLGDSDLEELDEVLELERGESPRRRVEEMVEMNRAFHMRLAATTRNDRIVELVDSLLRESARHDYFVMDLAPDVWTGHAELLKALKTRNPARAARAMREHLQTSRERMSRIFSDKGFF